MRACTCLANFGGSQAMPGATWVRENPTTPVQHPRAAVGERSSTQRGEGAAGPLGPRQEEEIPRAAAQWE